MRETLKEMFTSDESKPNYAIDTKYLDVVFPDFFNIVYNQASHFTVTVNEFAYLCIFLYPHYMEPVHQAASIVPTGDDEKKEKKERLELLIVKRGNYLGHKKFRSLLAECLSNLYIHSTSKEDILRHVEERKNDE